jgi:hypothetical protein
MASENYVGRYRQRREAPVLGHGRRNRYAKVAVAMTAAGIIALAGVALSTRATGWNGAPARRTSASAAVQAAPATSITSGSRNVPLGELSLHLATMEAITTPIAGDAGDRRLSWTAQVGNDTSSSVTIGDPTTILWTTDGSGHLAVSRQRVRPGAHQAVVISFELPEGLQPSSITLRSGSARAKVDVTAPGRR